MTQTVGKLLVSAVVLCLWGAVTVGWTPPQTPENMKLMDTLATIVVTYWIGSSSSSDRKSEMLHETRMSDKT